LKCYRNLFYFYDNEGSTGLVAVFCPLKSWSFPYDVSVVYYRLFIVFKEVFYSLSVKVLFI